MTGRRSCSRETVSFAWEPLPLHAEAHDRRAQVRAILQRRAHPHIVGAARARRARSLQSRASCRDVVHAPIRSPVRREQLHAIARCTVHGMPRETHRGARLAPLSGSMSDTAAGRPRMTSLRAPSAGCAARACRAPTTRIATAASASQRVAGTRRSAARAPSAAARRRSSSGPQVGQRSTCSSSASRSASGLRRSRSASQLARARDADPAAWRSRIVDIRVAALRRSLHVLRSSNALRDQYCAKIGQAAIEQVACLCVGPFRSSSAISSRR